MEVYDGTGNIWSQMGTWTVTAGPTPVSVTPSSGTGSAGTFEFAFTDPSGFADIVEAQMEVSAVLEAPGTCYIYYSRASSLVYLENDAGTGWSSPMTIGTAGTLSNSQCMINVGTSSVSTSGNNLTLNLALTFQSAYAGAKNTYALVANATTNSGWLTMGTWTVPGSGGANFTISAAPSSQTVAPGGGTSYVVTLTSVGGFSSLVSLTSSGWPSGAGGTFSPSSVTPTTGGATSTLSVTTSASTPTGTSSITVKGTSGSLQQSTSPSLTVSAPTTNFTVAVTPAQTMAPGDGTSYAVTVTSVNSFSGTVNLTASGLGSGATATFNPSSVTISGNGTALSTLTITTTVGAQVGSFTPVVKGTSGSSNSSGSTSLTLSTSSTPALQLSTLISCVASGSPATYCALPTLPTGSYYDVSTTVAIGHSNVTVTGGGTSLASPTILVRDPAFVSQMMSVGYNQPQPLTGVVIQDLTFCGNGNLKGQVAGPGCPALAATTCGASTALNIQQIDNNETVTSYTACSDLQVYNVDTGTYPQPFQVSSPATSFYNGPFSLVIANSDFEDSTGNAIEMYATNGKINDVWIHDTHVNYSAVAGIVIDTSLVDINGVLEDDRKVCDAWAHNGYTWANDPSLFRPRNIRIGDNNIFNGNFQGSIAEGGRWVAVRNNTFTNNYITYNTMSAGGTMTFDECADTIQIYNNMMTGPNTTTSQIDGGLELYGRNIYV